MKTKPFMIYKEVLEKRLARKKNELERIESIIDGGGLATAVEKRKFVELKAIVNELENCIDIAESMLKLEQESS
jgi:hypothetical protein